MIIDNNEYFLESRSWCQTHIKCPKGGGQQGGENGVGFEQIEQ